MYFHLASSDETLCTVVNSFKTEIERMNHANSLEEMRNLQESAVDDA